MFYIGAVMVESNNDEERFARIDSMINGLQRKSFTLKIVAAKLVEIVLPSVAISAPLRRPVLIADRRLKRRF